MSNYKKAKEKWLSLSWYKIANRMLKKYTKYYIYNSGGLFTGRGDVLDSGEIMAGDIYIGHFSNHNGFHLNMDYNKSDTIRRTIQKLNKIYFRLYNREKRKLKPIKDKQKFERVSRVEGGVK
ncbi:hypothetical protein [uncultured Arcobacter sp.]|uniref:hypothetical protein n=1 Tax=uncultured Arcobacter sp. TaxID=165434 RepID=UPI00261EAFD1|nr:hypothetical protein [uncultured Arcobacter sp.]